jgi:hypothetical protein
MTTTPVVRRDLSMTRTRPHEHTRIDHLFGGVHRSPSRFVVRTGSGVIAEIAPVNLTPNESGIL